MEDFALELAQPIGLGDGVGALKSRLQKPYLGNAFDDVTVAAFLHLHETVVADDFDAQQRYSRRWLWIVCVNGEMGYPVREEISLDGPGAARRSTLSEPLVETGDGGRLNLRRFRFLRQLPCHVQGEALFA